MSITPSANNQPLVRNDDTMRYRPLGSTGLDVSELSMGCMRLGDDQDRNTATVQRCIELGVNYFETTRFYCGGQCQQRTAPGLADRQNTVIASGKCGLDPNTTAYSYRREIERQLDILGLSHFKFFQVGWFSWKKMPHLLKRCGVLDAIRQAKDEGLIQYIGFTGHDTPENFIACIETGLFDSLTVPYNMINRMYEPTIARAGELGVGVVAMCPVHGGLLAGETDKFKHATGLDMPTTEMALHFVLANPNVSTACSGMTTPEMVEQNAAAIQNFNPDESEQIRSQICDGIEQLRGTLGEKQCTACRYCMPCPNGLDIPAVMGLYRDWKCYGVVEHVQQRIRNLPAKKALEKCDACGACIPKCPNDLPIPEWIAELRSEFSSSTTAS